MADSNINKNLPPQSIDAEKCLLGCFLVDENSIIKVGDYLKPRDFYKNKHKKVYEVMEEFFEKGENIDILTISNRLKEKEQLKEIGGRSYLTDLVNTVPTASNVENYAKIVQKKRVLRDLIQASQKINNIATKKDEDVDSLLDQAESTIFSIAQKSFTKSFTHVKDSLEEAFERIDKLSNKDELRGVPTGFLDLDERLAGLQDSDLIILAARPSMGKSSLALNIALNVAGLKKIPVGIFSIEMSKDQVTDRLIASQADVNLWKLRTGRLSSNEDGGGDFERIRESLGVLSEAPIYIDDNSTADVLQMKAMGRRLQAQHGLGLIIVDYLQLIQPRNNSASRVQQMTEISRALKGLARELSVPVLALSQLSRAVEKRTPKIPRLSDLRDTGAIEQDADVVMFIYREDQYQESSNRKNIADVIIAKHRNGPTGTVEFYFKEKTATFHSLDKRYKTKDDEEKVSSIPTEFD